MESTGKVNRIHVSQTTAALLIHLNKGHWLKAREEPVEVKGKGMMQTFWVDPHFRAELSPQFFEEIMPGNKEKTSRLIYRNIDVLSGLLKKIVAYRSVCRNVGYSAEKNWEVPCSHRVLEEVKDILELPDFDPSANHDREDFHGVVLQDEVHSQLTNLVIDISLLHRRNREYKRSNMCVGGCFSETLH
jgi:hypothetical protein